MDEQDLSRLLHESAAHPDRPVDLAAIDAGIGRRRRTRRAVTGAAAASLVLVVAVTGVMLTGSDHSDRVGVITPPDTNSPETSVPDPSTTETEESHGSHRPVEGIGDTGIAIQLDGGVSLVDLDGNERFFADLQLADPSAADGLQSQALGPLPIVEEGELYWWEPWSGRQMAHSGDGLALPYDGWVGSATPFLRGGPLVVESAVRWWLSNDMRVVTWTECESDCPYRYYDSLTGEEGEILPACWIAAKPPGDDQGTLICADGTQIASETGDQFADVGTTMGGEPARAVAAWSNGVVWLDHGVCHAHEALLVVEGQVRALLTETRRSGPSAIPLGVAPDGRMIVHLNAAACDAADPEMGVYLVDIDTRERELLWEGAALPGEVRAWARPQARIAGAATGLALDRIEHDMVAFGQRGVGRLTDGDLHWWWTDTPVTRAFSDGAEGLVFQMPGDHPLLGLGAVTGAILHMPDSDAEAEVLVPEGDNATLMTVAPLDGRATVLFTRHEFPEEPADQLDASQVLYALDLETGSERSLGEIGHRQDQVEELAVWADGMVTRRCVDNPCALWHGTGRPEVERIDAPEVTSGLDANDASMATVEIDWDISGGDHDLTLLVMSVAGEERARVPIPAGNPNGPWVWVDISDDGRSALVLHPHLIVHEPPSFDVVLVTGLDTAEPRVQIVDTDQALRFG